MRSHACTGRSRPLRPITFAPWQLCAHAAPTTQLMVRRVNSAVPFTRLAHAAAGEASGYHGKRGRFSPGLRPRNATGVILSQVFVHDSRWIAHRIRAGLSGVPPLYQTRLETPFHRSGVPGANIPHVSTALLRPSRMVPVQPRQTYQHFDISAYTKRPFPFGKGRSCANLAGVSQMEVPPGFEPGNKGFADLRLTAWLWHRVWSGRRDSDSRHPPWQGGTLPLSYYRTLWCLGAELNHRHGDFQSPALPTELPRQMATKKGLEPSTSSVTGWHSNQLNYLAVVNVRMVGTTGLEPVTPCL